MDLKVQLQFDTDLLRDHRQWTTPTSPNYLIPISVSTPVRTKPPIPNRCEYSIRDKVKLLQLADRIQSRTPTKKLASAEPLIPKSEPIQTHNSVQEQMNPEPFLAKVGTSLRRSKIYASFSPKRRSLNKLVKSDPAKTNIEHLVHRTSDPKSTVEISDNVGLTGNHGDTKGQPCLTPVLHPITCEFQRTDLEIPINTSNCLPMGTEHVQNQESVGISHSDESQVNNGGKKEVDCCRTRSQSIPRSTWCQSESRKHAGSQSQQSFWNEVGSDRVLRRRQSHDTCSSRFPQSQPSDKHKEISVDEKREGRPMSLDCSQRKAWLATVATDMDLVSSSPQPPTEVKRSRTRRPLSITHLHLQSSVELPEETETSSVSSTKSTTPSFLQRFSKTFSLRFGSSTPKPTPNRSCGSTPDVTLITPSSPPGEHIPFGNGGTLRKKPKNKVDPSSGKVRKRQSSITINRDDKCQSGDSGIQLSEPEQPIRSVSPISMKKLSLVDIPDDGFVSDSDDSGPISKSFHSLPLKYSRQRKAEKRFLLRGNVVQELLTTEANYVKSLQDIVTGFVGPCRKRSELFDDKTVTNIFSNVEDLLQLHARVLESLQASVASGDPSDARVGHVFIDWAPHFHLYSEYCYQNPMSNATVKQLCLNTEYATFFEACRRFQLMDKLPLHGFLLRPVQRICQYHLQLNELLKYTESSHPDFDDVSVALQTMKEVAMRINDTQQKFEALQDIVKLQSGIDGWEGEDLVPGNASVLMKGLLIKTSLGHKPKEVFVALLNNEMIITRKDYYKKGSNYLSARVPVKDNWWVDINGQDEFFGWVQNSWRVYAPSEASWILLTAPTPSEKCRWTSAYRETEKKTDIHMKMSLQAKSTALKAMLTESQTLSTHGSSTTLFSTGSTLPRLRNRNRKLTSLTKSDSDAMLIEVGKLRQRTNNGLRTHHGPSAQSHATTNSTPSSKFYI